jgi:two-component system, sensor histidine kinase YesM
MVSNLQQLTEKMTRSYLNMIQISQQVSPQGTVGILLYDYFNAQTSFEKYQTGQQISDSLVQITFANAEISYRSYIDPVTEQKYFSNLRSYETFSPQRLKVLKRSGSIEYHSLHQSVAMGLECGRFIPLLAELMSVMERSL